MTSNLMNRRARRAADVRPTAQRLLAATVVGVVTGSVTAIVAPWQAIPLVGWSTVAAIWALWTWIMILPLNAGETSALATREELHRAEAGVVLVSAAAASLIAVVFGVIKAAHVSGGEKFLLLFWGLFTIIASWGVVHTVFTLRYAGLYYTGPDGGVDFNEDDKPTYADFAYLAFTIGMTYQVSDTDLTTKATRHTALRHALLSYLFGAVIIAATINLAAGLVK
jgi:uncharacterized membrane protein